MDDDDSDMEVVGVVGTPRLTDADSRRFRPIDRHPNRRTNGHKRHLSQEVNRGFPEAKTGKKRKIDQNQPLNPANTTTDTIKSPQSNGHGTKTAGQARDATRSISSAHDRRASNTPVRTREGPRPPIVLLPQQVAKPADSSAHFSHSQKPSHHDLEVHNPKSATKPSGPFIIEDESSDEDSGQKEHSMNFPRDRCRHPSIRPSPSENEAQRLESNRLRQEAVSRKLWADSQAVPVQTWKGTEDDCVTCEDVMGKFDNGSAAEERNVAPKPQRGAPCEPGPIVSPKLCDTRKPEEANLHHYTDRPTRTGKHDSKLGEVSVSGRGDRQSGRRTSSYTSSVALQQHTEGEEEARRARDAVDAKREEASRVKQQEKRDMEARVFDHKNKELQKRKEAAKAQLEARQREEQALQRREGFLSSLLQQFSAPVASASKAPNSSPPAFGVPEDQKRREERIKEKKERNERARKAEENAANVEAQQVSRPSSPKQQSQQPRQHVNGPPPPAPAQSNTIVAEDASAPSHASAFLHGPVSLNSSAGRSLLRQGNAAGPLTSNAAHGKSRDVKVGQISSRDLHIVQWRDEGATFPDVIRLFSKTFGINRSTRTIRERYKMMKQALELASVSPEMQRQAMEGDEQAVKMLNFLVHSAQSVSSPPAAKPASTASDAPPTSTSRTFPATPTTAQRPTPLSSRALSPKPVLRAVHVDTQGKSFIGTDRPQVSGKTLNASDLRYYYDNALAEFGMTDSEKKNDLEDEGHEREASPMTDRDRCHFAYEVKRRNLSAEQAEQGDDIEDVKWIAYGEATDDLSTANRRAAKISLDQPRDWKSTSLRDCMIRISYDDERYYSHVEWPGLGIVETQVSRFMRTFQDGILPQSKSHWVPKTIFFVRERIRTKAGDDGMFEETTESSRECNVDDEVFSDFEMANRKAIRHWVARTFSPESSKLEWRSEEVRAEEEKLYEEFAALGQDGEGFDKEVEGEDDSGKTAVLRVWVVEGSLRGPRNLG